jgi:hypothetical protein
MSLDYTATGLSLRNAGMLIMEDGLMMYGRAINDRSWSSDTGDAESLSSFELVVLFSLAGIVASAALLFASSGETIAAMAAALTP